MRPRSIRGRMTAFFAASLAVLMVCLSAGVLWYTDHTARDQGDAMLRAGIVRVRQEVAEMKSPADLPTALEESREALAPDGIALLLVNRHGQLTYHSRGIAPSWPPRYPGSWRIRTIRTDFGTLIIALPWWRERVRLLAQGRALTILSLLVIGAGAVGAWVLVGRTLSPIAMLSDEARTASADRLQISLHAPSPDSEVVGLVDTLNGLLERIAHDIVSKERFYTAASHELRTPLQALSGHLEVALSRDRKAGEYRAALEEALAQTRRLSSLVQSLLFLNQVELASSSVRTEEVDLEDVCQRALFQLRPLISERGLRIRTSGAASWIIDAPPTHVEMLVRNLLENAVKYASRGGEVRLKLDDRSLEVSNDFPGATRLDMAQLVEPFVRVAGTEPTEGNGLGLAICTAVAQANGWTLDLSQDDRSVHARVTFEQPLRRQAA